MKTFTKEEILNKYLGYIPRGAIVPLIQYPKAIKAMQEYSDQQTANLKLINAKQGELIEYLKLLLKNRGFEPMEGNSRLQRYESELTALEKEPTAMEMIKEVFEPIQLGEDAVVKEILTTASNKAGKEEKPKELPFLMTGDVIKIYGEVTTVEGFDVLWNESLSKYEIIILTTGRADPFERSLDVMEILF